MMQHYFLHNSVWLTDPANAMKLLCRPIDFVQPHLAPTKLKGKRLWVSLVSRLALLALSLCLFLGTSIVASAQGISTGDGTWVWQNPLPQGNDLVGVWGAGANEIWGVGRAGTILKWNGSG